MNDFIERGEREVTIFWKWISESLFLNEESEFSKSQVWFQRFAIISIYLLCIVLWSYFLNWGRINWGVQDWIWEWRYSRILKEAVTENSKFLSTPIPPSPMVFFVFSGSLMYPLPLKFSFSVTLIRV